MKSGPTTGTPRLSYLTDGSAPGISGMPDASAGSHFDFHSESSGLPLGSGKKVSTLGMSSPLVEHQFMTGALGNGSGFGVESASYVHSSPNGSGFSMSNGVAGHTLAGPSASGSVAGGAAIDFSLPKKHQFRTSSLLTRTQAKGTSFLNEGLGLPASMM